jgi:hypothetical protein
MYRVKIVCKEDAKSHFRYTVSVTVWLCSRVHIDLLFGHISFTSPRMVNIKAVRVKAHLASRAIPIRKTCNPVPVIIRVSRHATLFRLLLVPSVE